MGFSSEAACKGMPSDIFFPERGADIKPALAICAVCPVQYECFEYAMANQGSQGGSFPGIWGGTTERERIRIRRGL